MVFRFFQISVHQRKTCPEVQAEGSVVKKVLSLLPCEGWSSSPNQTTLLINRLQIIARQIRSCPNGSPSLFHRTRKRRRLHPHQRQRRIRIQQTRNPRTLRQLKMSSEHLPQRRFFFRRTWRNPDKLAVIRTFSKMFTDDISQPTRHA